MLNTSTRSEFRKKEEKEQEIEVQREEEIKIKYKQKDKKKTIKKPTAPGVPKRSPIQVLSGPNAA